MLRESDKKIDKLLRKISDFEKLLSPQQEEPKKDISKEPIKTYQSPPPIITQPDPIPVIISRKEPEAIKEEPIKEESLVFSNEMNQSVEQVPVNKQKSKSLWDTDFAKKTDWEKFIGENLANKIGIAILVLGISFFVKFAIDKDWIKEAGRVVIGLASGGILIGLAHYTRNKYRSFSSVLVGGGITVFYFTIAFAFHEYHLLSQQAAFLIMVVITAFAVLLSLLYNRIELAILATIGGYLTPFLVSTGENNYVALFTYLAILNTGLLVLSWFKQWKPINIIALVATIIIFSGWLTDNVIIDRGPEAYRKGILFATIFYFQFLAMNIINNLRTGQKFGALDFTILLAINLFYFSSGMIMLEKVGLKDYEGLFTASLGVINLALAWTFFKRKQTDRNFIFLLIGLTLTYISLSAPIQLEGNYITLFWTAEAVVLFWLFQRSRISILKVSVLILIFLMLVSLIMDWSQIYTTWSTTILPIIANKGFITTLVAAIGLGIIYKMMKKEADTYFLPGVTTKVISGIIFTGTILLLYATGAWEINYQFRTRLPGIDLYYIYGQLYIFLFIFILLQFSKKRSYFGLFKVVASILAVLIYLVGVKITNQVSIDILIEGEHHFHFIAHWVSAAILIWLLYDLIAHFRRRPEIMKDYGNAFTWLTCISLVTVLSVELYYVFMWTNYHKQASWYYWENLFYRAALSILWGLCSFAMMWLGMKHGFKTLRIISLSLFTITLLKLFMYDIVNIPPGGKIAAFILLGILLLIISFMYQRLKKIIIDDAKE
jgi:uncharacterized membrane protein